MDVFGDYIVTWFNIPHSNVLYISPSGFEIFHQILVTTSTVFIECIQLFQLRLSTSKAEKSRKAAGRNR
jgi:hypothetical protein